MRGRAFLLMVVLSASAWTGCKTKPVRVIKAPTEQYWDLPPHSNQFDQPPTYPEDKQPVTIPQRKDGNAGMPLPGKNGGGGSGSPGMGSGSMGGPNMGGAGSGGMPGRGY